MLILHKIFPNAKFVYIIRDGRDSAYSFFSRSKGAEIEYDLKLWNRFNHHAYLGCQMIGHKLCYKIRYEQLVTNPELYLRDLIRFLKLDWTNDILHHDEYLKQGKLKISNDKMFKGFQQTKMNNNSIGRWRGKILKFENQTYLDELAPMLKTLNYTN